MLVLQRLFRWFPATMLALAACVASAASPQIKERGKLPIKPAFTPLPPGAVEPRGWLRDWAVAAGHGIAGHLDEYHPTFRDAWKGAPVTEEGADPENRGWPLEQCSYWLDGLVQLGYLLHDDALIEKAAARLNYVVEGVNRGGDSFIYWEKTPPVSFKSWAHSQMGRALISWYQASGDPRILQALVRVYANYPLATCKLNFSTVGDPERTSVDDGHTGLCNLDALLETYRFSGDRRLLERAKAAAANGDVESTIALWLAGKFVSGHGVGVYEQIRLPALFFAATGDQRFLDASRNAFRWIDENHLLPYGVSSAEEFLAGVGAFRKTETCDVEANIWSMLWLYRLAGDRTWGDAIERAFLNAAPAPIARDFKTMSYLQAPNRIDDSLPGDAKEVGEGSSHFTRLGYPAVLCCAGSVNRLIPDYVVHLWMATADKGLAATLYGPSVVTVNVGADDTPVTLAADTAYPFEETVRLRVEPARDVSFPLSFRIPSWCEKPQVSLNGEAMQPTADRNGFVRIERIWKKSDRVTLVFPMSVRIVRGHETEYLAEARGYFGSKPDELFARRRLPYASVFYGPLLFALPIPDKDPNTPATDARWQFALANDAAKEGADIAVERKAMADKWDWPLDAPLTLRTPARAFDWKVSDTQALPADTVEGDATETIRLVPYGCTKFRVSMFPVTEKAWGKAGAAAPVVK